MEYRTELSLEENVNNWIELIEDKNEDRNSFNRSVEVELKNLNRANLTSEEKFLIIQDRISEKHSTPIFENAKFTIKSKWKKYEPYLFGFLICLSVTHLFEIISFLFQNSIPPPVDFTITEFSQTSVFSNLTMITISVLTLLTGLGWKLRKKIQNSILAKLFNFPFLLVFAILTFSVNEFGIERVAPRIENQDINYVYKSYVTYNLAMIESFLRLSITVLTLSTYFIIRKGNKLKIAK